MGKRRKILLAVIIILLAEWGYLIGKIYYYSALDNAQQADAIVVLGASQWNGKPSPVFQSRLNHAYNLYSQDLADKVILTGGVGEGEIISEARAGKSYLLGKGIKEDNILVEEVGRTSKESMDEVVIILQKQNLDTIILVSDGFHMMRLKKMAGDLGIESYTSPVKNGPVNNNKLGQFKYSIRESWVYILYLIFDI